MTSAMCLILAEGGDAAGGGGIMGMLPLFVILPFLFYFMVWKPDQKRRATETDMRANLKKNDRVLTAGGIYGVVVNVQRDAREVTIKVDEATNTKLRVTMESIVKLVSDEGSADSGTTEGGNS